MSNIAANGHPKYITSIWHEGAPEDQGFSRTIQKDKRCRLLATRVDESIKYNLSLIEAAYNAKSSYGDFKTNFKNGAFFRRTFFLTDRFTFSAAFTATLTTLFNLSEFKNELVEALKLESRGYTLRRTDYHGKFSVKDVEQAMRAFTFLRSKATGGPLSWDHNIEEGAVLESDIFGYPMSAAEWAFLTGETRDFPELQGCDFSYVRSQPPEKIRDDHSSDVPWLQTRKDLRNLRLVQ